MGLKSSTTNKPEPTHGIGPKTVKYTTENPAVESLFCRQSTSQPAGPSHLLTTPEINTHKAQRAKMKIAQPSINTTHKDPYQNSKEASENRHPTNNSANTGKHRQRTKEAHEKKTSTGNVADKGEHQAGPTKANKGGSTSTQAEALHTLP